MSAPTIGVVLTGGRSERMGVDKASLLVDGKPLAVWVSDALWEGGCQPVECQGGDVETLAEYGLFAVADEHPGHGPLPAVGQALARHGDATVVIAACDLVDLDGDAVAAVAASVDDGATVAVAVAGGRRHLLAAFAPGSAPQLLSVVTDGVRSFVAATERLGAVEVAVAEAAVRNINTPADLNAPDSLTEI